MITLLLLLLRLLPFLYGGHLQHVLENLALRQQLGVYKRTTSRRTEFHRQDAGPAGDLLLGESGLLHRDPPVPVEDRRSHHVLKSEMVQFHGAGPMSSRLEFSLASDGLEQDPRSGERLDGVIPDPLNL